ncbi:MAG: sodium:solute symporter family protein, partial [Cytophagales bacterium]|nr:sodium:solute symporter family protein [Cytophagales bacterium]
DFALAGKSLPTWMCSTALFATWFGSETILGASSEFATGGILGVIEEPFGASLCLILLGLFFAKPFYRLNVLTFNDFFKVRFGRWAELMSSIIMVPSYLGWIAAQLVALGLILNIVTGIPISIGIAVSAFLVLSYTLVGGMWAVTITDFVQTIIIIVGLLVVAYIFTERAGGIGNIIHVKPPKFYSILPEGNGIGRWEYLAAWITVGLGSIPQQDVFQRLMTAKNEKVAANSALIGGVLYLSVALIPLYLILAVMLLYPSSFHVPDAQFVLPMAIVNNTSLPIQVIFFGALVSAIMSTCSGAMLAPATVLAENIFKPWYGKPLTDKGMLLALRLSVLVIGLFSVGMAYLNSNIYELVAESSAVSLVTLFVPMIMGLFTSSSSKMAPVLSMVFGICFWTWAFVGQTDFPPVLIGLAASFLGWGLGWFIAFFRKE